MKIYISGQITGLPYETALQNFTDAEIKLKGMGFHTIVNPMALEHNHDKSWEGYMKEDIKALCGCEAIAMLPNWKESKGAQLEKHLAEQLKLNVVFL